MRLQAIAPEVYAREVLPQTAALWAGRRDLRTYVAQTLEIARSGYGKRMYRTIGLYEGERCSHRSNGTNARYTTQRYGCAPSVWARYLRPRRRAGAATPVR